MSKEHTCQVSDHSSKPVFQEVAQKLKNYVSRKTAICHLFDCQSLEDILERTIAKLRGFTVVFL